MKKQTVSCKRGLTGMSGRTFAVRIAGQTVRISSRYDEIYEMCKDYLYDPESEGMPEDCIDIRIEDSDLKRERELAEEGETCRDSYLETLAVYRRIAEAMISYDTYLMHGSVLAVKREGEEQAVMFTAPSGTGKTTHTKLWLQQFADAYVVNGDKPLLRVEEDQVLACGTPWCGKEGMNRNCQVPLAAICILERSGTNRIEEIRMDQALMTLIKQTYRPADAMLMTKTMELIERMGHSVRFYRLCCNMEAEAAVVARQGMFRELSSSYVGSVCPQYVFVPIEKR